MDESSFSSIARDLIRTGLAITTLPAWDDSVELVFRNSLDRFMAAPASYRASFSHARFAADSVYDGYSHYGQAPV